MLIPLLHATERDGSPTTIILAKAETLAAAEPAIRQAIAGARRRGLRGLRIDVADDLTWRSVWAGRVKNEQTRGTK